MKPVIFNRCFGWLHEADGTHGIVMCSPLGYEELGTHRGWRNLAEKISLQGYPVLRFDYDGINDSLGDEEDANRVHSWLCSVLDAVSFLKEKGLTKISLVGLRFGGALATLAAGYLKEIQSLILIEPVVLGKNYIRELKLTADSWWASSAPSQEREVSPSYIDVIGDRIFKSTIDEISKIDLNKVVLDTGTRVLIFGQDHKRDIEKFFVTLKSKGTDVTKEEAKDIDLFLRDSVLSIDPSIIFEKILTWLGSCIVPFKHDPTINYEPESLSSERFTEFPSLFGDKLFGIITQPISPKKDAPNIIIVNTGPNHHVGNGRLSVILARHVARLGFTTLRFDLSNLGDSGDSDSNSDHGQSLYNLRSIDDIKQASVLMKRLNDNSSVIVGLCSGAYIGLHGALADDNIAGAVLVNLQRFIWQDGTSLQVGGRKVKKSTKFYVRALCRKHTWLRIIKGEVNLLDTGKVLGLRLISKAKNKIFAFSQGETESSIEKKTVQNWIKNLSDRNVKLNLFYSEDDPGLVELAEYFGNNGRDVTTIQNVDLKIIKGADHSLNFYEARKQFITLFDSYLSTEFNSNSVNLNDKLTHEYLGP